MRSVNRSSVSSQKKKDAAAEELGVRKQKRLKEKMIRLDDLIPQRDVSGGHRSIFGTTHIN